MTELTRNDPVVFHFRLGDGKATESKAGATVVFLPKQRRFGIALCCANDCYDRWKGRIIATGRAEQGPRSRIREKRFDSTPSYNGLLELELIRAMAHALVYCAAGKVENPIQNHVNILNAQTIKIVQELEDTEFSPIGKEAAQAIRKKITQY